MSEKISVLIPIFNVEKYLAECLESIINQTYSDLEIICINDGSTDNSLSIINKYAKLDDRIVLLDKENSGYGDSMNRGLSIAKGEYISIVESDDFIEKDMLGVLHEKMASYNLDVVKCKYNRYWSKTRSEKHNWPKAVLEHNIENKIINSLDYPEVCIIPPSIWSGLYRRSFLEENGIKFLTTPGASYQDTSFAFKVWVAAEKVMLLDYYGVNYRQYNPLSSINTVSENKIYALDNEYESIKEFLKKTNTYDKYDMFLKLYMIGTFGWNIRRMDFEMIPRFVNRQYEKFPELFSRKNNLRRLVWQSGLGDSIAYIGAYYRKMWIIYVYKWLRLKLGRKAGR